MCRKTNNTDFSKNDTTIKYNCEITSSNHRTNNKKTFLYILTTVVCGIILAISSLLACAASWYIKFYGDVGFDSILFTFFADLDGVNQGIVWKFLYGAALPSLFLTAVLMIFIFYESKKNLSFKLKSKKIVIYPFSRIVCIILSLAISCSLIGFSANKSGLVRYMTLSTQETDIYDEQFVNPATAKINFPDKKQNLIIIFLESVETTFLSSEKGGACESDLISELYDLAQENLNFSHNDSFGGASTLTGGTYTIGAMVSQTSGIPLKIPSEIENHNEYGQDSFLPGATSLSDILHQAGYYQALMVGSDAKFGGRQQYYEQHGTDSIYDLFTAQADGIIPEDYYVWWGMEDKYLFQYAKQKLTEISTREEPFAFTMLTVDTHAWGGYVCEYCDNNHDEQYDNVYECASKQIAEFVYWLQSQQFYENTTIVIAGDHLTMDNDYITRTIDSEYDRRVYNCFINAKATPVNAKNREFCTLDMFPTILASIGCEIEGDRLGLGTNLFSSTPTLCEVLGTEQFDIELAKQSEYYDKFYNID